MYVRFGRKIALLTAVLPITASWLLIGFATTVGQLYAARICAGLTLGFGYTALPIYLGEIASDRIRGSIGTLLAISLKIGILYAYSIGPYVSFQSMAWLALLPPTLFAISFVWFPESPYYLLGNGRTAAARHALVRLRRHQNVDAELDRMLVAVQKSQQQQTTAGRWHDLMLTENRKIVIIVLVMGIIQHVCGGHAVIGYAQTIFDKINSPLRGSEASIVLGCMQLGSAIFGAVFVDLLGRRPLLLMAGTGTAACSSVVALYFALERNGVDVRAIGWLPLSALMVFIVCYNVGITTVPYVLLGEICPKHLKAVIAALNTAVASVFAFTVGKSFQAVSDGWGSDVAFGTFAAFSYAFIPFVWFYLPETKGKPLDVILDEMRDASREIGTIVERDVSPRRY